MKLFYNPAFSENAYVNFKKSPVLFDAKIVNTAGLCGIIKLHAGICSDVADYGTRFVNYYAAMKKYMVKNPKNVMAASFQIDELNTAKKCLEWRDTLAAAGWTKSAPTPTERMKVLSGVEEFFNDKSRGEELLELIAQVENGCPLPQIEIITCDYYEDFSPAEVRLLKALIERGVGFEAKKTDSGDNNIFRVYSILQGKKGVVLDKADKSFEIWNFTERDEAIKYLSHLEANDFDVWINADNKEFDNWQKLQGKRLSGSEISGIPHTAQLLNIALTIFERPLNVYNIVEWLNTWPNPLPPGFKKKLAKRICESGGYYNDACKEYINYYITEYPDSKENIQKFLPDINTPYFEESELDVEEIKTFIKNLTRWCSWKLNENDENPEGKDEEICELVYVVNHAKSLLLFLDEYDSKTISYSDLKMISSTFSKEIIIKQNSAQAGSKKIINSTVDFCSIAEKAVWCDFYENGNSRKLTYSFLSPVEDEVFRKELQLWEAEKERNFIRQILLTPFIKTQNKLVLVTIDKIGSNAAPKSPVYIQLEKYFADKGDARDFKKNALYPFVKQIAFENSLYKSVKKIDNRMESDQEFVEIKNADFIKENWEDHQSYTSLESIINHPLDYVIDKYVCFSANPLNTMNDVATTKGLVAHAIIQKMFESQKNKDFEEVFEETVQSEGAVLLLEQNKIELQRFKSQIKENLDVLSKVIKANNFQVVSCEKGIGYQTTREGEIIQHGIIGKLDVKGFADMILEDTDGNLYIFDFKWTTSSKRHATLLEEKKSVQLTLYKELVSKEMKKPVKAVAYFLMPAAQFISYDSLAGVKQIVVNADRKTNNLFDEIQNSYEYRKEEVFEGRLEETTGWEKDEISYEQQREELGLMPMDYYDNAKSGPYNDIGLIKSRK